MTRASSSETTGTDLDLNQPLRILTRVCTQNFRFAFSRKFRGNENFTQLLLGNFYLLWTFVVLECEAGNWESFLFRRKQISLTFRVSSETVVTSNLLAPEKTFPKIS